MISIHSKSGKALIEVVEIASEKLRATFSESRILSPLKEDLSPVCNADLMVHEYLSQALPKILPVPVISEENFLQVPTSDLVWLIDPLDGTKEFLKGSTHFCINIALIQNTRPVLGILAAPISFEIFYACEGEGAFEKKEESPWKKLQAEPFFEHRMVTSYHHLNHTLEHRYQTEKSIKERERMGSALKFVKLIKGESSLYPRFAPCSTWDIAAGHCLLKEVGGNIVDFKTGIELTYQAPWNRNMAPFLATGFSMESRELAHLRNFEI